MAACACSGPAAPGRLLGTTGSTTQHSTAQHFFPQAILVRCARRIWLEELDEHTAFLAWRQYARARRVLLLCMARVAEVEANWDLWGPRWVFAAWCVQWAFTHGRPDVRAHIQMVRTRPRQMQVAILTIDYYGVRQSLVWVEY